MAPRIHLGINTCFAVKRWPEPEQWIRIVTQELGLEYCQFSLDLVDPMLDADATRAYADEARTASGRRRATHTQQLYWPGRLFMEPLAAS